MKGIDILHAEIGTVSSRQDGSVAFRVITPELRPSEAGALMSWHGKACRVSILPDEDSAPEEPVTVSTGMEFKSSGQKLRTALFLLWKNQGEEGQFQSFYDNHMTKLIQHVQGKLSQ